MDVLPKPYGLIPTTPTHAFEVLLMVGTETRPRAKKLEPMHLSHVTDIPACVAKVNGSLGAPIVGFQPVCPDEAERWLRTAITVTIPEQDIGTACRVLLLDKLDHEWALYRMDAETWLWIAPLSAPMAADLVPIATDDICRMLKVPGVRADRTLRPTYKLPDNAREMAYRPSFSGLGRLKWHKMALGDVETVRAKRQHRGRTAL